MKCLLKSFAHVLKSGFFLLSRFFFFFFRVWMDTGLLSLLSASSGSFWSWSLLAAFFWSMGQYFAILNDLLLDTGYYD